MRWVTLFLNAKNENLMKDVGLIPYFMYKNYGMDAYITSFDNDEFTYLNKEVKGLKHEVLPNRGRTISNIVYLLFNSKKIDVLNLYHWGRMTLLCSTLYKKMNHSGKLYVKLDMDMNGIKVIQNSKKDRQVLGKIINKADLISVESKRIYKKLKLYYNGKICYIPNGLYNTNVVLGKKKKQIVTVGRLGTQQKATEILLEAFACIADKIPEWKLILIGKIETEFKQYVKEYYERNPELKNRVLFKGHITDKTKLNYYYAESKIFALPSRWEGFALVLLEAMSYGCYVVTTDSISPVYDLISSDDIGLISQTDNVQDFADKLMQACHKENIDEKYISDRTINKYSWTKICTDIAEKLNICGEKNEI